MQPVSKVVSMNSSGVCYCGVISSSHKLLRYLNKSWPECMFMIQLRCSHDVKVLAVVEILTKTVESFYWNTLYTQKDIVTYPPFEIWDLLY